MQADCKQQHFLTRKQTPNPPIKPNFNPADPYSGCCVFFFPLDSFFLLSLKGNSAVWWMSGLSDPPDSLELPSHFAELRAKYTESTQSFAALIPRKWNFTPKPKQTRPHIFFTRLQWAQSEQKVPISSAHSNIVFKKSKLLIRHKKKSQINIRILGKLHFVDYCVCRGVTAED